MREASADDVDRESNGAVEIIRCGSSPRVFVTCEHASAELPVPWVLPTEDSWLEGTHWTHDIGARPLARELCQALGTAGVLAKFSRLLADPNRPEGAQDLFRTTAEGRAIALNGAIDAADRDQRLALWKSYHRSVDREVAASQAAVLLSVHTFTPHYEGNRREMEIGVLYDEEEDLAERFRIELAGVGFRVAMNEPYSGKGGLMYSVDRHAKAHGRRAIELEVRQDLAIVGQARKRVTEAVRRALP